LFDIPQSSGERYAFLHAACRKVSFSHQFSDSRNSFQNEFCMSLHDYVEIHVWRDDPKMVSWQRRYTVKWTNQITITITSQSRHNHLTITWQPHYNHNHITSQSHHNHITITSQSHHNHWHPTVDGSLSPSCPYSLGSSCKAKPPSRAGRNERIELD
jgi:hypothetical protein